MNYQLHPVSVSFYTALFLKVELHLVLNLCFELKAFENICKTQEIIMYTKYLIYTIKHFANHSIYL